MSRYPELTAKVDAFFERVAARHGDDMACQTGCSDCCHVRLSVTGVEAAALQTLVGSYSPEQRQALAANIASAPADRCAALAPNGRCMVYAARPVVCRSHGAPVRIREGSLPVITSCSRNFTARGPAAADADCVIDQETLSMMTLAIDRAEGGDGTRYDLANLLECAADV